MIKLILTDRQQQQQHEMGSSQHGGLCIRTVQMLAPSAFLASAASMQKHNLQKSILPQCVRSVDNEAIPGVEVTWNGTLCPEVLNLPLSRNTSNEPRTTRLLNITKP